MLFRRCCHDGVGVLLLSGTMGQLVFGFAPPSSSSLSSSSTVSSRAPWMTKGAPTTCLPSLLSTDPRRDRHHRARISTIPSSALNMALVPLSVDDVNDLLVVGPPSGPQYAVYWGRTKRERYNRFLESSIVGFVGVFFSYFLSFVVGGFVSTVIGALFLFWGILSPEFKARQRNWEFLGGRQVVDVWTVDADDEYEDEQGLYGSLYFGRVDDVCVVDDTASLDEYNLDEFQDYDMDSDELEQLAGIPYLLRLRLTDEDGRELQIHARMCEDYLDIQSGMPVTAILLSTSQSFSALAALTDIFIPDADAWVGDYPYLDQNEMEALLAEDDELWDLLQSQGSGKYDNSKIDNKGDTYDDDRYSDRDDADYSGDSLQMVPIRRRKY